ESAVDITIPDIPPEEYTSNAIINRFGINTTNDTLKLLPALADRPVVIQSELPFNILPKQSVTYYVSSPLWIQIKTSDPEALMLDIPLSRPSDTWFGPSTMEGTASYASRTHGRLSLDDILFRPHRAITVVLLRNQAEKPLLLKKLNLPVSHLSLYESEDGYLWTQPIVLDLKSENELSDLRLIERAPTEARNPLLLSQPREPEKQNILTKTLSHLIH
ncbi:hypothetical protein ACFL60_04265, partial [Candidatus Omnitrophota bacterium]